MGKRGRKPASASGSTTKYEVQEHVTKVEAPKCELNTSDNIEETRKTPGEKKLLRQMERDKKYAEEMFKSKVEPAKSEKKSKSENKKKKTSESKSVTKENTKKQEKKHLSSEDSSHTTLNYKQLNVTKTVANISVKDNLFNITSNEKSKRVYDRKLSNDRDNREHSPSRRDDSNTHKQKQSGDQEILDRSPSRRDHSDTRHRNCSPSRRGDSNMGKQYQNREKLGRSPLRQNTSDTPKRNNSGDREKLERSLSRQDDSNSREQLGDREELEHSLSRRDEATRKRKKSEDLAKPECSTYKPPARRNENQANSDYRGNEKSQAKYQDEWFRKYDKPERKWDNDNYKKRQSDKNSWRNRNDRDSQDADINYDVFLSKLGKEKVDFNKVKEISGDLFTAPDEYSLGHCVAEDMSMGAGIAIQFRNEFKRSAELLDQNISTGGVAILKHKDRYIYYLVTKRTSYGKPTLQSLFSSLMKMKKHMVENKVKKLAIPQIGCGLDRLDWGHVKYMLQFIFQDTDVQIDVYILQTGLGSQPPPKPVKARKTHAPYPLTDILPGTGLIYFGTEDSYVTEEIKSLDTKYPRLIEFYKNQEKSVGKVLRYEIPAKDAIYGFIWKQRKDNRISYKDLEKCCFELKKINKKDEYSYFGFDAPETDSLTLDKIINVFQSILYDYKIYICWPEYIRDSMPVYNSL